MPDLQINITAMNYCYGNHNIEKTLILAQIYSFFVVLKTQKLSLFENSSSKDLVFGKFWLGIA